MPTLYGKRPDGENNSPVVKRPKFSSFTIDDLLDDRNDCKRNGTDYSEIDKELFRRTNHLVK